MDVKTREMDARIVSLELSQQEERRADPVQVAPLLQIPTGPHISHRVEEEVGVPSQKGIEVV